MSEAPTNNVGDGNIPTDPIKRQKKIIKRSKFRESDMFEVDTDTYDKCVQGKKLGARWDKYIEDPELRDAIRKSFQGRSKQVYIKRQGHGLITSLRGFDYAK